MSSIDTTGVQEDATGQPTVRLDGTSLPPSDSATTIVRHRSPVAAPQAADTEIGTAAAANWPPACFAEQYVPIAALNTLGVHVSETAYTLVGAGLGSFVAADMLRIAGVRADQIVVIGPNASPYGHYGLLTRNSQIPSHERIRSNSESTPDNIWGWPGYALREIIGDLRTGNLGSAWGTFWQILGEPTVTDTYTPRIGDVFRALDRESERISWRSMYRYGRVRAIRKTDDGRYVIAYSTRNTEGSPGGHALLISRYVHLALGYPTVTFLPDLQRYREETGDFQSVVNAYEDHDHVYEHLRKHGGLVLVRGRGIVASRILQRLYEERVHNPQIGIVHLLRSPVSTGHRDGRTQRPVSNQFEFQPFNWPRDCWTGSRRKLLERLSPEERVALLEQWGGTTTASRKDWIEIVNQGLREGWYQQIFGAVDRVERDASGRLITVVKTNGQITGWLRYTTDYIIDATGLDARAVKNPLVQDMVEHYRLALNPLQRLHVGNDFEVPGMRDGRGQMYAAGAITLGGPNAGVDTFLGLQYASWRAVDALRRSHAPGIGNVNGVRSVIAWLKWTRGVRP